ncbi:MAG: choice-of-anchor R domain-containing protein, partial [Anaerolineae bacterium]|nr:choice-of-anchor R domain-containing protein [Anaerolineae bacterium]
DLGIRYQARFSPALDETITVQHGKNTDGFGRVYRAYVTQDMTATQYGSSNQDSDVAIQGPSGAGATESSGSQTGLDGPVGDSGGVDYRAAQSFQMSAAGAISQFTFTLTANTGSPTGDLGWEIRDNNAGKPGSTVLESGSIANASVTASAQNTVNITNGAYLAASTTYWLVLYSTVANEATNNKWNWQAKLSGTYANGNRAYSSNGGTSWTTDAVDHTFTVTTSAVTSNDSLAQGVQVSSVTNVKSVKLWLRKSGTPAGNLTVKIETDSSGSPSGTVVTNGTSATVAASSLATSYGWIEFTFSTPPSLSASTQYHLVLETTDTQSNTNYVEWGADGSSPSYASGEMKHERSATWSAESKDAVFKVISDGIEYINPVMVDWWSSTRADMVAQAGDSGGADGDTKSTFKCKASAGFADVTVEVVI